MDVEAIARRIAQDHGVTVLESDVIETLEKLKAANKEKITPPATNAATNAAKDHEPAASLPAQLTEPVKQPETDPAQLTEQHTGDSASVKTQAKDDSASLKAQVNPPQNEANKIVIPAGVKPMPIDLIDDLLKQNYTREGIEAILKENKFSVNRNLITERIKIVRALPLDAQRQPLDTRRMTPPLTASQVSSAATPAKPTITNASNNADTLSVKTSENMGNSGISGGNGAASVPAHVTEQQTVDPALVSSKAAGTSPIIPPVAASLNNSLPTDLPSVLAALQQLFASYKQPSGTVPAASEQVNEEAYCLLQWSLLIFSFPIITPLVAPA
jgi:hypothetical protein